MLHPVLGSPVQVKHRHTGVSLVTGLEKGVRIGASSVWGEAEGAGAVQPEERMLRGISSTCINTWWGGKEDGASLLSVVLSDWTRGNGSKLAYRK